MNKFVISKLHRPQDSSLTQDLSSTQVSYWPPLDKNLGVAPKEDTWRETLIHALEKRLRERERENHSGGAGPPNLLNIAPWWACIFLLASLPISLAPRRSCPRSKCPSFMHVRATSKETSQQTSEEKNRRKAF